MSIYTSVVRFWNTLLGSHWDHVLTKGEEHPAWEVEEQNNLRAFKLRQAPGAEPVVHPMDDLWKFPSSLKKAGLPVSQRIFLGLTMSEACGSKQQKVAHG